MSNKKWMMGEVLVAFSEYLNFTETHHMYYETRNKSTCQEFIFAQIFSIDMNLRRQF